MHLLVPKVPTVLTGRDPQGTLKNVAHRVDVGEAALGRDRFHAVAAFFQPAPHRFHSKALDKFCRRDFHFPTKDAREIAWTHRYPPRQKRDGEWLIEVIEHPGFQFEQWFAIGQLE